MRTGPYKASLLPGEHGIWRGGLGYVAKWLMGWEIFPGEVGYWAGEIRAVPAASALWEMSQPARQAVDDLSNAGGGGIINRCRARTVGKVVMP